MRNFIHGEPIPGIVYEYGLNQRFLPEITLAEVNSLAKDWMPDRNRLVVISAPEKDRPSLPTEAKLAAVINGGERRTADGLRRHGQHAAAARAPPVAGSHRHDVDERRAGHHRVAVVQRRPGRAQADDVQAGRNPVSGREPGRHVARERRRTSSRLKPPPRSIAQGGLGSLQQHRSEQDSRRHHRVRQGRHRRDGGRARRRRLAQRSRDDVSARSISRSPRRGPILSPSAC